MALINLQATEALSRKKYKGVIWSGVRIGFRNKDEGQVVTNRVMFKIRAIERREC